jgi:hypothetical protein
MGVGQPAEAAFIDRITDELGFHRKKSAGVSESRPEIVASA